LIGDPSNDTGTAKRLVVCHPAEQGRHRRTFTTMTATKLAICYSGCCGLAEVEPMTAIRD
jgi:hypothetical protein